MLFIAVVPYKFFYISVKFNIIALACKYPHKTVIELIDLPGRMQFFTYIYYTT